MRRKTYIKPNIAIMVTHATIVKGSVSSNNGVLKFILNMFVGCKGGVRYRARTCMQYNTYAIATIIHTYIYSKGLRVIRQRSLEVHPKHACEVGIHHGKG